MAHVKQTKLKVILQYNDFFLITVLHNNSVTCGQNAHIFKLQQTIAKYAQNRQVWRRKEKASFLNYEYILTNDCVSKPIKQ